METETQIKPKEDRNVLAIWNRDFTDYGCPHCGGIFGYSPISGGGAAVWICSDCNETTILLTSLVNESPIEINGVHPSLSVHPRKGNRVDREKLIKERELSIHDRETESLTKWAALGFGSAVNIKEVGTHSSKSRTLPIISAVPKDIESKVKITWFAQNYYFHFLGLHFHNPVYTTLMYPISALFSRYALSGHVNTSIAPPITNIMKMYHDQERIGRFGINAGSGYNAALTVRYLHEISKLDMERIMDICLRKTRYGKMDIIHGNYADFIQMIRAVGLKGKAGGYDFKVRKNRSSIFTEIQIDQFDTNLMGSSVHFTLKKGVRLPDLPFPAKDIYIKASDLMADQGIIADECLYGIPVSVIKYKEGTKKRKESYYPINQCYLHEDLEAREFVINVANPLDAALVALFLTKVIDPIIAVMAVNEQQKS